MRPWALLVLVFLCGCTRGGHGYYGTTEPRHGPDEIWSSLGTEPESIDPGKAAEASGGMVVWNLFAGLTQPHPENLAPMPDIAERWDISEDGQRYVFHLRRAQWSDGAPLTAADFEYAWRRVLDPRTGSRYASFLYCLKRGEAYNQRALVLAGVGDASEAELRAVVEPIAPIAHFSFDRELDAALLVVGGEEASRPALRERLLRELAHKSWQGRELKMRELTPDLLGVHARDDVTLEVELETPLPYFLYITQYYTTMPVPRHVLERLEREGKHRDLWTRPENIVSNGAFRLAAAKFRQFMLLEKNPRYWGAAKVKLQRVKLSIIESTNTVLNMYEAGELDTIGSTAVLPFEFLDMLRRQREFQSAPWIALYFYWFNTQAPPLDDVRVRGALSLAIDRNSIVEHVTRAGQIPSSDVVPPGLAGYRGLHSPIFDPKRARALLREAGYGPERPLPKLTLRYNTSEGHKQIAEAVQAMWQKHLGISVELENLEWNVYLKALQSHDFQIARYAWIGDYPDPFTFLEVFGAHNGSNSSGWVNPKYDELLRTANRQRDPLERLKVLEQAELTLRDAVPAAPIYVYTRSELIKPYLRGHVLNYQGRHMLKYWWVDQRFYSGLPNDALPHGFPPQPAAAGGS